VDFLVLPEFAVPSIMEVSVRAPGSHAGPVYIRTMDGSNMYGHSHRNIEAGGPICNPIPDRSDKSRDVSESVGWQCHSGDPPRDRSADPPHADPRSPSSLLFGAISYGYL